MQPSHKQPQVELALEQLLGGVSPEDVPASLTLKFARGDGGMPVKWDELTPFAMPGAPKHKLHIHVYDNGRVTRLLFYTIHIV